MANFCERTGAIISLVITAACAPAQSLTRLQSTSATPLPTVSVAEPARKAAFKPATTSQGAPASDATTSQPTVVRATEFSPGRAGNVKIRIILEETELTATLVEGQTTQDFISLLPLTLTLEDYAGTEKVSSLPRRLTTEGTPAGSDPSIGDITYYAPWGNLAIFYRDFGYASGLVILGKLEGSVEVLDVPGSVRVRIELIE